ncbi:MAG: PadR family transcriptional regulator [Candidatus Aminicenantes bacterium]|nr:MAG: PadR family transcriptional regulator [Candidatus Aminicenantes bacterium]
MNHLTKNEEIILLSIMRIEDNAYGVSIKNQITELTGDDWNYGLLYATLDQLVKKGLLIKKEGKPMPERGGRRKIFYTISRGGHRALEEAYKLNVALWGDVAAIKRTNGESA